MTRCEALGADLSAFLDGECGPEVAARVREHLEGCADCRNTAALWRSLGSGMREEDPTPAEFPQIHSAVAARLAAMRVSDAAPLRGAGWLRGAASPRAIPRKLGWLAAAAVLVTAGGIVWVSVFRGDDARALAELEGRSRLAVLSQQNASEAMRLEIAAIRLRARAAGASGAELARLEADAKNLFEAARAIDGRVAAVQSRLEQGGLLALEWPVGGGRNRGILR